MDGSVGIGGDPCALLDRVAGLLFPGGLLIAETALVDVDERVEVQVVDVVDSPMSDAAFLWERLGTPALLRHARRTRWSAVAH
ncbi:hypothetical protein AB0C88_39390 [Streptomyces chartreusis]|uniref:hypothetical protein n=1 Tax=Streptomyces chartreusis TaxID=1969 RepID=UPI0033C4AD62